MIYGPVSPLKNLQLARPRDTPVMPVRQLPCSLLIMSFRLAPFGKESVQLLPPETLIAGK